jgi:protein tyrosine phosphatase (PTP) superfamily phosphohydrolase (DUF442 family)
MKAWHPEEKEIVKFLKTVTDKTKTPVFVHCQHGADRTGLMCKRRSKSVPPGGRLKSVPL